MRCQDNFSQPFRNILVVMLMSPTGNVQRQQDSAAMYNCFFPHIRRYKYCDDIPREMKHGFTCMFREALDGDLSTVHGMEGFAPRRSAHLQYEFMVDAMGRWPDFEGYIFMRDDVVLNFWNFPGRRDFKKAWRAVDFPDPDPNIWRQHMNMSLSSRESYSKYAKSVLLEGQLAQVNKLVNELPDEQRTRLFRANSNTGLPAFRMANSDFYYVPKTAAASVASALSLARRHMVFHEVAVPLALDATLEREQYEVCAAGALTTSFLGNPLMKMTLYDPCWDYFRPMRPAVDQEFGWMVETVFRYGPLIEIWDCLDSGKNGLGPEAYERLGCGPGRCQ